LGTRVGDGFKPSLSGIIRARLQGRHVEKLAKKTPIVFTMGPNPLTIRGERGERV
jgi:hypothetical protein